MKIGIYTYGTRGDLQPYVALALGLKVNGHHVIISATEDFRDFVEGYGIDFLPLWGNAERMMNSFVGDGFLQTNNSIDLMRSYFKFLHTNREKLRESYYNSIQNVDYVIANSMTLPIVSALVEKLKKKMVLTYFMPPVVQTAEFPLSDFDFFNFEMYNRFTYKIAQYFFWKFIQKDTNEYRRELALPELSENLIHYLDKQKILDLYCISPSLIPQPKDWESHHKITGFINIPTHKRDEHFLDKTPAGLAEWLEQGDKPIYIGFGSNGVGNTGKTIKILTEILEQTNERILFCTGWSQFNRFPDHKNIFIAKYVNHEAILPKCKVGIFHGGAGTLATMLRHNLPVIVVSFYTDQPTWGKIVERKQLGIHIPVKTLSANKLISAIYKVQDKEIKNNVSIVGQQISNENGLDNAINEIEKYFIGVSK